MGAPRKYRLDDWPTDDRGRWERATHTGRSVVLDGPWAVKAPETKRQAFIHYSRWLEFLRREAPAELARAPEQRLGVKRLRAFMDEQAEGRSAQTVASTINHFINALHIVVPQYDTTILRKLQHTYTRQIRDTSNLKRPPSAVQLMKLAVKLMDEATRSPATTDSARTYRDGLLVAIWVSTALRRKNLARLTIGTDFLHEGDRYRIAIKAQDAKARQVIEHLLPQSLTRFIDAYLRDHRPRFMGASNAEALWMSTKGGGMVEEAVWDAIRRRTRAEFGEALNLHAIRAIAATELGSIAGLDMKASSGLLGHSDIRMTDRFYRRRDSVGASRVMAAIIADLRRIGDTSSVRHAPAAARRNNKRPKEIAMQT